MFFGYIKNDQYNGTPWLFTVIGDNEREEKRRITSCKMKTMNYLHLCVPHNAEMEVNLYAIIRVYGLTNMCGSLPLAVQ